MPQRSWLHLPTECTVAVPANHDTPSMCIQWWCLIINGIRQIVTTVTNELLIFETWNWSIQFLFSAAVFDLTQKLLKHLLESESNKKSLNLLPLWLICWYRAIWGLPGSVRNFGSLKICKGGCFSFFTGGGRGNLQFLLTGGARHHGTADTSSMYKHRRTEALNTTRVP